MGYQAGYPPSNASKVRAENHILEGKTTTAPTATDHKQRKKPLPLHISDESHAKFTLVNIHNREVLWT